MFKFRFALALCLSFIALGCSAANDSEDGYINVSSSITKDVDPDKAEVIFYVETSEKNAQDASEKNKVITNKEAYTIPSLSFILSI